MQSLPHSFRALVLGASGTIGSAFARVLEQTPGCESVCSISRRTHPAFNYEAPEGLPTLMPEIRAMGPYSVVIDATGILSIDSAGPEKSLAALRPATFERVMRVNAMGPLLMLSALMPDLVTGRCLYGKLSARVGSITDNQLGGWYSYRASKAALNMLLQTTAIELHRRRPDWVIAALQPGTVRSALSERFVASRNDLTDPQSSADGLLRALDTLPAGPRAHFIDDRGHSIPW